MADRIVAPPGDEGVRRAVGDGAACTASPSWCAACARAASCRRRASTRRCCASCRYAGGAPVAVDDAALLASVVHAAFGQRRKTLRNALSAAFDGTRSIARSRAAGIDGSGAARRSRSTSSRALTRGATRCLSCPRSRWWCARCGRGWSASASAPSRPAGCRCARPIDRKALERACVGARVDGGAPRRQVLARRSVVAKHVLARPPRHDRPAASSPTRTRRARRTPTRSSALRSGLELRYVDPRRFGVLRVYAAADARGLARAGGARRRSARARVHRRLSGRARCAASKRDVKAFLLDQSRVAGLGNIYVCEALFRAEHRARRAAAIGWSSARGGAARRHRRRARRRHREPRHQLLRLRRRRRRSRAETSTRCGSTAAKAALPPLRRRAASRRTGWTFHVFLPALPEIATSDRSKPAAPLRRLNRAVASVTIESRRVLATAAARGVGAGRLGRVADVAVSRRRRARIRGARHAPS